MSYDAEVQTEPRWRGVSREDAETLCLIRIIGAKGCSSLELCLKLGMSTRHEAALAEILQGMVSRGDVFLDEHRAFLTAEGREWMEATIAKIEAG